MLNRQVQNMLFLYTFQFFVYDHGPGAHTKIRSPNKYLGKVDKRRFTQYNDFYARPSALNRVKTNSSDTICHM